MSVFLLDCASMTEGIWARAELWDAKVIVIIMDAKAPSCSRQLWELLPNSVLVHFPRMYLFGDVF